MSVTPIRPGVEAKTDDFIEHLAQGIAAFTASHGKEPDACVFVLLGDGDEGIAHAESCASRPGHRLTPGVIWAAAVAYLMAKLR